MAWDTKKSGKWFCYATVQQSLQAIQHPNFETAWVTSSPPVIAQSGRLVDHPLDSDRSFLLLRSHRDRHFVDLRVSRHPDSLADLHAAPCFRSGSQSFVSPLYTGHRPACSPGRLGGAWFYPFRV